MAQRLQSDRTMPPKEGSQRDKRQMSLMQVFRAAHAAGDARKQDAALKDGERDLTKRSRQRRDGVDERTLRRELSLDLGNLMNTVRLDATLDLDDWPYIRKSVINYGFDDLSSLSINVMTLSAVKVAIRRGSKVMIVLRIASFTALSVITLFESELRSSKP